MREDQQGLERRLQSLFIFCFFLFVSSPFRLSLFLDADDAWMCMKPTLSLSPMEELLIQDVAMWKQSVNYNSGVMFWQNAAIKLALCGTTGWTTTAMKSNLLLHYLALNFPKKVRLCCAKCRNKSIGEKDRILIQDQAILSDTLRMQKKLQVLNLLEQSMDGTASQAVKWSCMQGKTPILQA